jgi:riboflavin biosynthesis pyrimidine reductase
MIPPRSILDAVGRMNAGKRILIEGGPRLLGEFYAQRLLDEQFLTLAPQIAGREYGDARLGLVMGQAFPPDGTRWGALSDVRRGGSHLFLRYTYRSTRAPRIQRTRSAGRRGAINPPPAEARRRRSCAT